MLQDAVKINYETEIIKILKLNFIKKVINIIYLQNVVTTIYYVDTKVPVGLTATPLSALKLSPSAAINNLSTNEKGNSKIKGIFNYYCLHVIMQAFMQAVVLTKEISNDQILIGFRNDCICSLKIIDQSNR